MNKQQIKLLLGLLNRLDFLLGKENEYFLMEHVDRKIVDLSKEDQKKLNQIVVERRKTCHTLNGLIKIMVPEKNNIQEELCFPQMK